MSHRVLTQFQGNTLNFQMVFHLLNWLTWSVVRYMEVC